MGVTRTTVSRWIDGDALRAHRTPGGHRRVLRDDLVAFCRARPAPPREPLWPRHCVLVVDDQEVIRSAMVKLINLLDPVIPVLLAEDAIEAGELFARYQPAIVFLDLVMPGQTGFAFHQRLREMDGGEDAAVVVITGAPGDSMEMRARGMGIQRFLRKPLTSAAIALILEEFLPEV